MTVYPETARSLCARFDSSPCVDRGQEIVVIGCDLYNGSVTGGVACNMNANSNASANHAGPSVLVVEYCGDRTDASCSAEKAYCIPKNPVDGRQQAVCFTQNQREEVRELGEAAGALTAEQGMHNTNYVVYPAVGITSPQNANNPQPGDPCPTLTEDSRNYLVGKIGGGYNRA